MSEIKIVDIPVRMEKFYGKGKMLHPNTEMIEEAISEIPLGKVLTMDGLCEKLATDFGIEVTCPMRSGNAVKKIAGGFLNGDTVDIPFWRVIRSNGMVIKSVNYEFSASKLEGEGFSLVYAKSGDIRVEYDSKQLFRF